MYLPVLPLAVFSQASWEGSSDETQGCSFDLLPQMGGMIQTASAEGYLFQKGFSSSEPVKHPVSRQKEKLRSGQLVYMQGYFLARC